METTTRITDVLFGSIVVLVTGVSGIGAALGGWVAGRRANNPAHGALAGGLAGVLGALPWACLVYLAAAGAIGPIGYHEGVVHVGVNPADPGLLALWQEVALSGLVAAILVSASVAGGLLASGSARVVDEFRPDGSAVE